MVGDRIRLVTATSLPTDLITASVIATNVNMITDAQLAKFASIEDGATADQTASEIKIAYESNGDTNVFTDTEVGNLRNVVSKTTELETDKIDSIYIDVGNY